MQNHPCLKVRIHCEKKIINGGKRDEVDEDKRLPLSPANVMFKDVRYAKFLNHEATIKKCSQIIY